MASRHGAREAPRIGRNSSPKSLRASTADSQMSYGGRSTVADSFISQQATSILLFAHIAATVCDPAYYRTIRRDRGDVGKVVASSSSPGDWKDAGPTPTSISADVQNLTQRIMSDMIEDLIRDPEISHIREDMPPAVTPYFAQLPAPIVDRSTIPVAEAQPLLNDAAGDRTPDDVTVLQEGEASNLINKIMENTIFNIVQEISHGDMDLKRTPRRVVMMESPKSNAQGGVGSKDNYK